MLYLEKSILCFKPKFSGMTILEELKHVTNLSIFVRLQLNKCLVKFNQYFGEQNIKIYPIWSFFRASEV